MHTCTHSRTHTLTPPLACLLKVVLRMATHFCPVLWKPCGISRKGKAVWKTQLFLQPQKLALGTAAAPLGGMGEGGGAWLSSWEGLGEWPGSSPGTPGAGKGAELHWAHGLALS